MLSVRRRWKDRAEFNLNSKENNNQVIVYWSAPQSLDVTPYWQSLLLLLARSLTSSSSASWLSTRCMASNTLFSYMLRARSSSIYRAKSEQHSVSIATTVSHDVSPRPHPPDVP